VSLEGPPVLQRFLLVLLLAATAGCAGFQPRPLDDVPFLERAATRTEGELQVTVAVPSVEEARALFDSKLHKKRIQPVWLEIDNRSDRPAWFFPYTVDPDYFAPLEVAWKSHRTWAKKTNRRIDAYFFEQAVPTFVAAGGRASGFVFVNLDLGHKYVPVGLVQDDGLHEFEFVLNVPGFRADHSSVDFRGLYAADEVVDLSSEDDLRQWAAELPCCTTNKKATRAGDPLNFVLVASDRAFVNGVVRAGWDETAAMTSGSKAKTGVAAVFGKTYRNAPISPLYAFERPQDIGLQKARWNIHQRNHLRLWLAPVTFRGTPVWVGQISRDIGSRLTSKTSTFTTHKIDPDVDEARDFLLPDLIWEEVLGAFAYTGGVGASSPDAPGRNLTGDPYFTDGLRAVLFLSESPVSIEDVRYLEWERPPER